MTTRNTASATRNAKAKPTVIDVEATETEAAATHAADVGNDEFSFKQLLGMIGVGTPGKGWAYDICKFLISTFAALGAGYGVAMVASALLAGSTSLLLQVLVWGLAIVIAVIAAQFAGQAAGKAYDMLFGGPSLIKRTSDWFNNRAAARTATA